MQLPEALQYRPALLKLTHGSTVEPDSLFIMGQRTPEPLQQVTPAGNPSCSLLIKNSSYSDAQMVQKKKNVVKQGLHGTKGSFL